MEGGNICSNNRFALAVDSTTQCTVVCSAFVRLMDQHNKLRPCDLMGPFLFWLNHTLIWLEKTNFN